MVANGRIPDWALTPIPGGGRLLADAAVRWLAICAEVDRLYGWTPKPTGPLDSYRPYSGNYYAQLETFQRRYSRTRIAGRPTKVWNGVTYWLRPGQATAAVPGTSNHGWACAVDVTGLGGFDGLRYRQFAAVANRYGWTNSEGRRIGEPWHWVDVGTAHLVANGLFDLGAVPNAPSINAPTPIEEDDLPSIKEVTDAIYSMPVANRPDGSKLTLGQALAMLPELDRRTQALLAVPVPMDSRERTIRQQVAETPVIDRPDGSKVLLWQAVALAASGTTAFSAKDIAAAIPGDLASQVANELAKRLAA
jgi:hypothetical protein